MMKTLGERIRELREKQDLSLRELAGKIGVSAAFMSGCRAQSSTFPPTST